MELCCTYYHTVYWWFGSKTGRNHFRCKSWWRIYTLQFLVYQPHRQSKLFTVQLATLLYVTQCPAIHNILALFTMQHFVFTQMDTNIQLLACHSISVLNKLQFVAKQV
jgi:hypothetical protein